MPVIVLTNHYGEAPLSMIREEVPQGFVLKTLACAEKKALLEAVEEADYLLASGRLAIDREILKCAPRLKMVQRTGVGLDTLDMAALKERGIPVYVNRGVNAVSVAEHTVMLILSVLRRITTVDAELRRGIWKKQENGIRSHQLFGKTVGFVGMGHIGQKTAGMLGGFGTELLYYTPARKEKALEEQLSLTWVSLEELLERADILVLQCALNAQTRGMIGAEEFARMKKGSILVNTARGPLVEEKALLEALQSGKLSGAGLDVFEKEPLPQDSPFLWQENVVLSPHIGGITHEAFRGMMRGAMENIALFDAGRRKELEDRRVL